MPLFQYSPDNDTAKHAEQRADCHCLCPQVVSARQHLAGLNTHTSRHVACYSKQSGLTLLLALQDVEARRAEVRKYQTNPAYKKEVDDERRARKKAEASVHILCASCEWVASATQECSDAVSVQSVLSWQHSCLELCCC